MHVSCYFSPGPPEGSLSFGPTFVVEGRSTSLPSCHVTSFPPAVITWSKVEGTLNEHRVVSKDGQLSIKNTEVEDSGLYQCKAANGIGLYVAVTRLIVVSMPRFTVSPPSKLEVTTNQTITIPCQATGSPQPFISWVKESGELPAGRSRVIENGTLQIWNPENEDSGRYTCVASLKEISVNTTSPMELTVTIKKRGE